MSVCDCHPVGALISLLAPLELSCSYRYSSGNSSEQAELQCKIRISNQGRAMNDQSDPVLFFILVEQTRATGHPFGKYLSFPRWCPCRASSSEAACTLNPLGHSQIPAVPAVCLPVLLNFRQVLCKAARMKRVSPVVATDGSSSAPQAQWGHRWRRRTPSQAVRLGQLQECRKPIQVQAVTSMFSNT